MQHNWFPNDGAVRQMWLSICFAKEVVYQPASKPRNSIMSAVRHCLKWPAVSCTTIENYTYRLKVDLIWECHLSWSERYLSYKSELKLCLKHGFFSSWYGPQCIFHLWEKSEMKYVKQFIRCCQTNVNSPLSNQNWGSKYIDRANVGSKSLCH